MVPTFPILLGTLGLSGAILMLGGKRSSSTPSATQARPRPRPGSGPSSPSPQDDPYWDREPLEQQSDFHDQPPNPNFDSNFSGTHAGAIVAVGGWVLVRDQWGRARYVPTPYPSGYHGQARLSPLSGMVTPPRPPPRPYIAHHDPWLQRPGDWGTWM